MWYVSVQSLPVADPGFPRPVQWARPLMMRGMAPIYNLAKFSQKQLHENDRGWARKWRLMRHLNTPMMYSTEPS